jgi:uncharacterized protein
MIRRLRRAFHIVLHLEDTPHRLALAFGIGVWIAFFPILGLHTLMALAIAYAFGLSRGALLLGAYINNPWTIAPLYLAGTTLGCALLGRPSGSLVSVEWGQWEGFTGEILTTLRPYLLPFVVGNTLLGLVFGALGYFALRAVIRRRRRGDEKLGSGATPSRA